MVRLLVLWILSERSSYGYEISKALGDPAMRFWFGVEDASIYSALRTLAKHGHAREVGVEQEGARPPRTRYAITAKGRGHYRELLAEAIAQPRLSVAPIDVALAARGDVDAASMSQALAQRAKALHEMEDEIEAHGPGTPSAAIVSRNLALVRAERAWLHGLDQSKVV